MSDAEKITSPSKGATEADEAKENSKIKTDLKGIEKIIGYIDDEVSGVDTPIDRVPGSPSSRI
jgi:hypothetical protein